MIPAAPVLRYRRGQVAVPRLLVLLTPRVHLLRRTRGGELGPLVVGAAGGLREGEHHPLAGHGAEERLPIGGAPDVLGVGDAAFQRTAAGARAPREDPSLQGADPRRDEVDMAGSAVPPLPRPVLVEASFDAPSLEGLHGPLLGTLHLRRSRESRTDLIQEHLGQRLDLRSLHPLHPDPFEDGIVGGQSLAFRSSRRAHDHGRARQGHGTECAPLRSCMSALHDFILDSVGSIRCGRRPRSATRSLHRP